MGRGRAPVDIQNGISVDLIIAAMKGLLLARREGKIGRITFLKTWTRLRRILNLTPEYARWRWLVRERAGGACERCAEAGQHAHHIEPLAYNPDRALDPDNGEYLCVRCHKKHHRAEARQRSDAGPTHRNAERATAPRPHPPSPRRPQGAPRR